MKNHLNMLTVWCKLKTLTRKTQIQNRVVLKVMIEMKMESQCCERFQKVRGGQQNVGGLCLVDTLQEDTQYTVQVPEPRSAAGTQLWYATGPPSTVSLSHHELQTHLLLKPDLITSNLSH